MLTPELAAYDHSRTPPRDQTERPCSICGRTFRGERGLALHALRMHGIDSKTVEGGTPKLERVPSDPTSLPAEPEPLTPPEPSGEYVNCPKCTDLYRPEPLQAPYCVRCRLLYS